ncbi:MAG: serine/threonine-protein kinase [Planctomycetota bacterium]|nr:serine/threonine-protein kinase [Planctomycetota bacterium]
MLDRARVRQVFADAADLPAEQVAAFLDHACGDDAALRREVESLLVAASRRPGFLGAPTAAPPAPRPVGESVGTTIDQYRLLEEVGQGGFGTVYAAEQLAPVQRRVAVKILKLGMDTRAVIARFEAERQALAMMDHANIARVFDAGATESGRPYFVMELVKGEAITSYCDQNNLDIAERLGVFVQVCRAVQHAHAKGVVHRDIKPGNVLVSTQDGRPHAKVIDFGIAKATQQHHAEKTAFTELRQFVGTPEYMSPEQAEGSQNTDTRTDVYSLGVVLYELLTGATPFDPVALRAAAYDEIKRIIREVEPPKPSTRVSTLGDSIASVAAQRRTPPARLSPLLRGDLDWVVMRCLEKDRARRYPTPDALAADLEAFLRGDAVSAVPPTSAYRVRKFAARNRGLVAAIGAVFAVLLLGVAGTTRGMIAAQRAERTAQRERGAAATVRDFLRETFEGVAPQVARGRDTALLSALMDNAAARIESGELRESPLAALELRLVIAEVNLTLARYEHARRITAPIDATASMPDRLRSRLLLLRAELALADSDLDRSESLLADAQRIHDSQTHPDPVLYVQLLGARAHAALERNRLSEAIELQRRALSAARALPRPDPDLVADRLYRLGNALNKAGHESAALEAWADALRVLDQAAGDDNDTMSSPTRVDVLVARAALHAQHADPQLALADLHAAQRLGERLFTPNHPTMLGIRYALANVHLHSGDGRDALAEFAVLLAANRASFGPESLHVATTLDSIAEIHFMARRWSDALDTALEVERIRALHLPPEQQAALGGWTTIVNSLCRLGRSAEALPLARRSFELQRATLEPASEPGIVGRYVYIQCLYAANQLAETIAQGRSFITLCAEQRPDDPPPSLLDVYVITASAMLDNADPRDLPECERFLRTCIQERLALHGENDPRVAFARIWLGRTLGAAALAPDMQPPDGGQLARLREAESLIAPNFQTLADNVWRLDPSIRARRVHDAADSLIALYDAWDRFEPGMDRSDDARKWRERRDAVLRAVEAGLPTPTR